MAVEANLPTLGTVLITAAIDSINPCAIGVLILMMSVLLAAHRTTKQLIGLGLAYIGAIFFVYLAAGLGLIYAFSSMPLILTEYLSIIVGILIIIAGIIEIKDYFWYGQGFSLMIPPIFAKKLHNFTGKTTVVSIMLLGAFVAAVELPCTGAPYLAIITLLAQYFDFTALIMLIIYNIIFVAPLLIILFMVAGGKKIHDIKQWKQNNRTYMRLAVGIMLVLMGWLLILIANGTINFG